jgi:hypothetical protein
MEGQKTSGKRRFKKHPSEAREETPVIKISALNYKAYTF